MVGNGGVYVYVSEQLGKHVRVFRMADNGELTKIQELPLDAEVMPTVITPDRQYLLAATRSEPYAILSFAINGLDGTLSLIGRTPAPGSAPYICMDRAGRYLMGAYNVIEAKRRGGLASIQPVKNGVAQLPSMVIRTPPKSHCILVDPSDRFALLASCDGDAIVRFRLDHAAGELSPDGLAPVIVLPKTGPRHMKFHPNNKFLYLINEYDGSVIVYRWNAENGTLHEIQTVSAGGEDVPADGNWRAADLHFTPDGRWFYASVRHDSSIAAFSADPLTGLLAPVGRYATIGNPRGFCIDPSGRYLFCAGFNKGTLVAFTIDQGTGALTQGKTYQTGAEPGWVQCVRLP